MKNPSLKSRELLAHDRTEMNVIFIHSRLDDYGLTPQQFRVYAHLARRAGQREAAWPGVESIGQVCRLHTKTVRRALKILDGHNLIRRQARPGETCLYVLTAPSQWRPSLKESADPCTHDTPVSEGQPTPANASHHHPSQTELDEGNPVEEDPQKKVYSTGGDLLSASERIYTIYPRKVGRPAALTAIQRAITAHGFDFVEGRTKLFAETCTGPQQFIPHPRTWYNQERFNDDPATWATTPTRDRRTVAKRSIASINFNQTKF